MNMTNDEADYQINLVRTRAHARGATPLEIELNVFSVEADPALRFFAQQRGIVATESTQSADY